MATTISGTAGVTAPGLVLSAGGYTEAVVSIAD
jgi:hypothetical protein